MSFLLKVNLFQLCSGVQDGSAKKHSHHPMKSSNKGHALPYSLQKCLYDCWTNQVRCKGHRAKDQSVCVYFSEIWWCLLCHTHTHTHPLVSAENWNSPMCFFFLSKTQMGHISWTLSIPAPTRTRIPSQWKRKTRYSHSSTVQRFPGCNGRRALPLLEGWINR